MIGANEVILILAIAVFLFGGKKVVDWARSIGQAKKAFNEELNEEPAKTKKVKATTTKKEKK